MRLPFLFHSGTTLRAYSVGREPSLEFALPTLHVDDVDSTLGVKPLNRVRRCYPFAGSAPNIGDCSVDDVDFPCSWGYRDHPQVLLVITEVIVKPYTFAFGH